MTPTHTPLPIDPFLPRIVGALAPGAALVLSAEPGAGKTTRVPRALLDAGRGAVLVLEPRRLAVRLAARRVAEELGEPVGRRIGYQVRFEEVGGAETRVRFVTEGVLVRRLLGDPQLSGVAVVLLDEFHERSLEADLALALLARLRRTARPDLALGVMSATIESAALATFLEAEILEVPGRVHPVSIEYATKRDDRPQEQQVASAALRAQEDGPRGDVLVFLPGAAEIRRAAAALAAPAAARGVAVLPLHGDLPAAEQDRAVRPGDGPRIILSTNVAETSITIAGVTAVVDSGLRRAAGHSPWSGLPTRATVPISRASAAQRAGRAGRVAAGRCLRLYTRADHDARPAFDAPEIRAADLAGTLLTVAAQGADVDWFEAPPAASVAAAQELLARLGALDGRGGITELGRAMLRYPLHPRAARVFLGAIERGVPRRGALLAALLGVRDVRRSARASFDAGGGSARGAAAGASGPSDLLDQADAIEAAERDGFGERALARAELDPAAAREAARVRDRLLAQAAVHEADRVDAGDEPLLVATLLGFPDRVARRRGPGVPELVFAGGGAGRLAPASVVQHAPFVVVLDAEEQRGRGVVVRLASAAQPEWLFDLWPERVRDDESVRFDPVHERVELVTALRYDGLALEEAVRSDAGGPAVEQALFEAARAKGVAAFCDPDELAGWIERVAWAAAVEPSAGLAAPGPGEVAAALATLCAGRRSFRELREAGLLETLQARLAPAERALVERLAPRDVRLPGGRTLRVHYDAGKPPWVESYLQDFFGMSAGPALGGRPLVLHLLAPSRRPVQVTQDLASFWERHYPQLRTQLMRRYPKHQWPEDPRRAEPPRPRR